MERVSQIGRYFENRWPAASEIEHMFSDYTEEKWAYGGASGARFTLYGACGTDGKDIDSGRVDAWLNLVDFPDAGIHLHFSKQGGGVRENYYCLWNAKLLGDDFISRHGDPYSKAHKQRHAVAR